MKTALQMIRAYAVILLVLVLIFAGPWLFIFIGGMLSPAPPKPAITYGEFPFKLVYELNGEEITVEDTVICEFDGFGWNEGSGKHREWKRWLASNPKEDILLIDETNEIYVNIGSPEYYMGEEGDYTLNFWVFRIEIPPNGKVRWDILESEDELFKIYGIRIISYEFSDPIVNSFGRAAPSEQLTV